MTLNIKLIRRLKYSLLLIFSPLVIQACQNVAQPNANPTTPEISDMPIIQTTSEPSFAPPTPMCSVAPPVFENYTVSTNGGNFKKVLESSDFINSAIFSSDNKNIIYRKYNDKNIEKLNLENQEKREILQNTGLFSLSPDKKQIAYIKSANTKNYNDYDLFISDIDGVNQKKINENPLTYPVFLNWSPDSKKIAIDQGQVYSNIKDILLFDLSGKNYKISQASDLYKNLPWSPDSKKIAFISEKESNSKQIYYFDLENNQQKKVSNDSSPKTNLSWSANSNKIFYYPNINGKNSIYSINTDGSEQKIIADGLSSGDFYTSDENKYLAYSVIENGRPILYLLDTITLSSKRLTDLDNRQLTYVKWLSDYKNIVFSTYGQYDGEKYKNKYNNDIYAINSDGTNKIRLTNSPTSESIFDLASDNKTILFNSDISFTGADGCSSENIENWDYRIEKLF